MRKTLLVLVLALLVAAAAGCGQKLVGIEILASPRPVYHGEYASLTAIGQFEGWGKRPVIVNWYAEGDSCVNWNPTGPDTLFVAAKPGITVFTAMKDGFIDTYEVNVLPSKIVRMEISSIAEMEIGDIFGVYARGYDQMGRMLLLDPNWSVTDELGEFYEMEDFQGFGCAKQFKALKGGVGTISVEKDGTVATTLLIVNPYEPYLASMTIHPAYYEVLVGAGLMFHILPKDQAGKYYWLWPTWSLEGDVGNISPYENDIIFHSTKPGTGILHADYGDFSATATIVVKENQ